MKAYLETIEEVLAYTLSSPEGISQKEAKAYLDSQNFTREQKAQLWTLINSKWKNNPYD